MGDESVVDDVVREIAARGARNATTDSGGSVRLNAYGRPCSGVWAVATDPKFPIPAPPYIVASLFRISSHTPLAGAPIR